MIENDMAIKLLPTLLEVLALFYFAEHFLTAKVSKMKRYIANICFYLLDCGAIYAFQENSAIKYAVVILLIFLWAKYVYRVTDQWRFSVHLSVLLLDDHGLAVCFHCVIFWGE